MAADEIKETCSGLLTQVDQESLVCILRHLSPAEVCRVSQCCRSLRAACKDTMLWKWHYSVHFGKEPLPQEPEDAQWLDLFKEATIQTRMHALSWDRLEVSGGLRPAAREGHAMCSIDDTHILVFGGFGQGIRNDVYILELLPAGRARWHRPSVTGTVSARYGHSFVRCGPGRDLFLSFGGLTRGGYVGETNSLAVLRLVSREGAAKDWRFAWLDIKPQGDDVTKRGYAALAATDDGRTVFAFGGITDSSCCSVLSVLDVATWTWSTPDCHGEVPCDRFGSAAAVWDGKLWILGGGQGNDLLRSGVDLTDIHCMDIATFTWRQEQASGRPSRPQVIGRCCAYQQVGSKLIVYGGSLRTCGELSVLDMNNKAWINPTRCGIRPKKRMSCGLAWVGGKIVIHGGWVHSISQVGDIYVGDLTLGWSDVAEFAKRGEVEDAPECSASGYAGPLTRARGAGHPRRRAAVSASSVLGDHDAESSDSGGEMDIDPEANPHAIAVYNALCSATSASLLASGINISQFFRMQAMRSNMMAGRRHIAGDASGGDSAVDEDEEDLELRDI